MLLSMLAVEKDFLASIPQGSKTTEFLTDYKETRSQCLSLGASVSLEFAWQEKVNIEH